MLYQSSQSATTTFDGELGRAGESMYGLWLLILFGILPAGLGAAIAYIASRDENPSKKVMLLGALAGAVIGLIVGVLLAQL